MPLKTTVNEEVSKESNITFPRLMINHECGRVILATKLSVNNYLSGYVVAKAAGSYDVGYSNDAWTADRYEPFYGSVTITQERD